MKLRTLALIAATLVALSARAEGKPPITVAKMKQAPTIDGQVKPGEWDPAVRTTGFQGQANRHGAGRFDTLEVRGGTAYVGFTDDKLYVAVVSEMPPDGKLYASRLNRDSDVIFDEGIEIWIDPNRAHRAKKDGDLSFYQFIGNPRGTVYDVQFDPSKGAPAIGWNGDWEYANTVDEATQTWTAELSIPFAQLGWEPGQVVGKELGVLVARNFKNPWLQTTWLPHLGSFVSWTEYVPLKLTDDAPTVQITGLGDKLHEGALALDLRLLNPGPARQARITFKATSSDMPGLDDAKTIDLPAGGEAKYSFRIPDKRFHETANHEFQVTVTEAGGDTTWFHYRAKWQQAPEKAWHVRVGPNPDAAVRMLYYPSYSKLKLLLNPGELTEEAEKNVRSGTVEVQNEAGEQVATTKIAWEDARAEVLVDLPPKLPADHYRAVVTLDGWADPFVREFHREYFPWERNRFGLSNEVFAPFTPLQVRGDTLGVVLREYTVGDLGMWSSVKARGNEQPAFEELLAAPIQLRVDDGQPLRGKGKYVPISDARNAPTITPHKLVYQARSEHPAVVAETRCTTEFDGCQKVELTLRPGTAKQELQQLWLEIPLRDRRARLWHVSTTGLRLNPAGTPPAGDGKVWDSTEFPDGNWNGNFKPYIWLGAEERGLCWFADNDAGWVLHADEGKYAPCLELHRQDGALTLRVNLVQEPITIEEPRKIVFGLMATPAKPMPKGWREVIFASGAYGNRPTLAWMGSTYWGAYQTMKETYPINRDMSILNKMQEMRLTGGRGVNTRYFRENYAERNLQELPGPASRLKTKDQILRLVDVSLGVSRRADYQNVYWEEFHSVSTTHPETRVFGNEWSGHPGIGSMHSLAPSYLDFQCWYGAEFIRRGIGLYFDNTFPKRAYDPMTTAAYTLPNGRLQPSANMWRHRTYLRRIWTLHQQLAPARTKPIMMLHMTNTHIAPYMVWNESNLDLEWFYGPEPQQSKYPHELLRAQSLGLQTGNIPLVLARVDKTESEEQKQFAYRTRFGTMFVHEIKAGQQWGPERELWTKAFAFGYGADDCTIHNYWHEDYPLVLRDDACKSILLRRGDEALAVFCTWRAEPTTVTVATALKFSQATDEESGEELPFADGKLSLKLPAYGVRMIRLK